MGKTLKKFYDWALASLNSRWGLAVFALITFLNSSLLPISPYFMLIPMCLAKPKRWLLYSVVAIIASVIGGYLMWILGYFFWEGFQGFATGHLPFLHLDKVPQIAQEYSDATFWSIVVATLSPVPYKVVALASGLAHVDLWDFTWASVIGRGSRLTLTAFIIAYGGPKARSLITRWTGMNKNKRPN
ncbi:MAG: VTT domain-containing protein [Verrucomicrobiota bacterium]|nr:VTT domain-containing protein [Verrucomicrobiota bacterium]